MASSSRARTGLLLALLAVAVAAPDGGDILDPHAAALGFAHHGPAKLVEIGELVQRSDQIYGGPILQSASGPVDVFGAQRARQVVEGQGTTHRRSAYEDSQAEEGHDADDAERQQPQQQNIQQFAAAGVFGLGSGYIQ